MGLDMYMYGERYLSGYDHSDPLDKARYERLLGLLEVSPGEHGKHAEVKVCLAYWRKANAIHRWLVANVQDGNDDGGTYPVTRDQLLELRKVCSDVLSASELAEGEVTTAIVYDTDDPAGRKVTEEGQVLADTTVAEQLLPTTSGFFFGSTDYDQWYYGELESTIEQIDAMLELDGSWEFSYHASW